MYKIFVNEKPLYISDKKINSSENILYESDLVFEIALDKLFNTNKNSVNIYSKNKEKTFCSLNKKIIPVYGAGGVVLNKNKEYLFIHRNSKWDLPKGHIEKDETKENAALREVEEECSLHNLEIKDFISETYHIYYDNIVKQYRLKVVYWFYMYYGGDEKPKPQTEENIDKVEWISKQNIKSILSNTYANIKDLVQDNLI